MEGDGNIMRPQGQRSSSMRLILAFMVLAFLGGLAAMAWFMTHWQGGLDFGRPEAVDAAGAADPGGNAVAPPVAAPQQVAKPAPEQAAPATPDARIADLEQRLSRISLAAAAASGYANRAEAIMTAFAARRALDAGAPLGYIESQLRLLFGDAQPKAVATIVNAAADPVTINKLRAGLEDIEAIVRRGDPEEGWWSAARRQIGSYFVIHAANEPSTEPAQRLDRARRDMEAGQMEEAISEVAGLPARPAIAQWLEQARRYNEARRALDVIEAAAILEPRNAPIVASPATGEEQAQGSGN